MQSKGEMLTLVRLGVMGEGSEERMCPGKIVEGYAENFWVGFFFALLSSLLHL